MCGIYGYIGSEAASPIVLDSLRKIEYRGHDSWGIATLANGDLHYVKQLGYIAKTHVTKTTLPGNCGIGHVRWATHGMVSKKNAHPHFDCKHEIAVVHNGVIYNDSSVRDRLSKIGHCFISDTDTELFAHLLEEKSEPIFIDTIYKCLKEIDAQYSFLILTKKEPNKIYAARNKSPLKIGIGENGIHVSSDIVSLVGKVSQYVDLKDGDVAEIGLGGFKIYDKNKKLVQRELNPIDVPEEMVKKEPPYFLKEVYEQERVIKDIISFYIRDHKIDLGIDLNKIMPIEGAIVTGAGSSFFAAMVGEYYLKRVGKLFHVESILAAELKQKYEGALSDIPKDLLLIALSQSGETRDVLDAIEFMRSNGVKVLSLGNRPHSEASKISNFSIDLRAGIEMSVIASKTFVAEILMLLFFAIASVQHNRLTSEIENIMEEIEELPLSVKTIFNRADEIERIAKNQEFPNRREELAFFPLSSGINIPVALEVGRKLEEGLYVHAIGTSLGASSELKHGPLTRVSDKMLIFIIPSGSQHQRVLINMNEAKARGARIIAVATEGDEALEGITEDVIWIPKCNELLTPILSVIPLQLLTYYMGEELKRRNLCSPDLDRPRNLAKSVTVE